MHVVCRSSRRRARSRAMKRAGLSPETLAVFVRNKELEQREKERGGGPGRQPGAGVSSASVEIQRRIQQLENQNARMAKELKIKGNKASGAGPKLPTISSEESVRFDGDEQLLLMDDNLIRHLELRRMLQKAQELDVAFLVDTTSSMEDWIDEVKNLAPKIANDVQKAFPKLKLRVAFVPYRDYAEYDRDEAEKCDFTDSFQGPESVFVSAIAKVEAAGGGDHPEDVFSGLERVATLNWRSKTRVLIHIADMPCHGQEFHDENLEDDYPKGDLKGRDISKLLAALRHDCQILNYLFCHITDHTKKMMKVFRKRAPQGGWIQEEKLDQISSLLEVVVSASCESIAMSSRIVGGGPVPKYVPVAWKNEIPDWKYIEWKKGVLFSYKPPATLEDLFKIVENNESLLRKQKRASKVKIARRPFTDEGIMRWPYHAQLKRALLRSPRKMVVKRFKELVGEHASKVHTMEAYCEQMEVQTVAAFLAEHFNQELEKSSLTDYKTVQFTAVSVLRVGDSTYYNMEMWLEGRWIRYSNNVNYVNTKEYADTLHAFSHWTHQRSNGLLMVTDLQGVQVQDSKGKKVFMLCDPAIHCKHVSRYELTNSNWSTPGMEKFFETHCCNSICHSLNLKPQILSPA